MCQNMTDVDAAESVVDFSNQPVPIAFNVEDRPLSDGVRARKSIPNVCQIFPLSLLPNPEPRVQRSFKVAVPRHGFLEPLSTDYVHAIRQSESALCSRRPWCGHVFPSAMSFLSGQTTVLGRYLRLPSPTVGAWQREKHLVRQNLTKTAATNSFIRFASCEHDTSHNANLSRGLFIGEAA